MQQEPDPDGSSLLAARAADLVASAGGLTDQVRTGRLQAMPA